MYTYYTECFKIDSVEYLFVNFFTYMFILPIRRAIMCSYMLLTLFPIFMKILAHQVGVVVVIVYYISIVDSFWKGDYCNRLRT